MVAENLVTPVNSSGLPLLRLVLKKSRNRLTLGSTSVAR
jgi:hypothetical protein